MSRSEKSSAEIRFRHRSLVYFRFELNIPTPSRHPPPMTSPFLNPKVQPNIEGGCFRSDYGDYQHRTWLAGKVTKMGRSRCWPVCTRNAISATIDNELVLFVMTAGSMNESA